MPPFRKQETLDKFRCDILHKFQKPGFPAISECIFVSGTSGENIENLRRIIHQSALRMNQETEMGKIVSANISKLFLLMVTLVTGFSSHEQFIDIQLFFLGTDQLFGVARRDRTTIAIV